MQEKTILYYSPVARQFDRFLEELGELPGVVVRAGGASAVTTFGECSLVWFPVRMARDVMAFLDRRYAHWLVMDLRFPADYAPKDIEEDIREVYALLQQMDEVEDLEARYGFHRIAALVGAAEPDPIDALCVSLGHKGVTHVMRQHPRGCAPKEPYLGALMQHLVAWIRKPRARKNALCLSGGGITGIFYELGAVKCLDDCLIGAPDDPLPPINQFDMYFGISAGAVNCGVLTAGYAVEEMMAAIAGVKGGRMAPLDLSLFNLSHFHFFDVMRRLRQAVLSSLGAFQRAFWRRQFPDIDKLLLDYTELVGPPFHSNHFEKLIAALLQVEGATNDFRALPRELYIGASDQDAKKHVLFGAEELRDIPISKAIQASLSIHPAFSAVEIEGRYYEDGAVTSTSGFSEAIRRGANLIFVFDPFLPFVSKEAGYTNRRGILYNIDQDIRTISFTRYESVRNWALRKHPNVSSYTFVPSNRSRQLLSNNPMDHRPFLLIWRDAYLSTFRRIELLRHRIQGDLEAHGWGLSLDKARRIAEQLENNESPAFSDFFLERDVVIRTPPLSLQQSPRKRSAVEETYGRRAAG